MSPAPGSVASRHAKFPKLFTPISLGGAAPLGGPRLPSGQATVLRNRFLMSAVYTGFEEVAPKREGHHHLNMMAEFYATRARHGTSLIVCGGVSPSLLGRWYPKAMSLSTFDSADAFRTVTDAVHAEGGKILLQLLHGGRSSCSPLMFAPSSVRSPVQAYKWSRPLEMPTWYVRYVATEYQRAAALAHRAGFDGVELPLCHGTLLHNFLVPSLNLRQDRYGGASIQERMTFVLEVLNQLRDRIPDATRGLNILGGGVVGMAAAKAFKLDTSEDRDSNSGASTATTVKRAMAGVLSSGPLGGSAWWTANQSSQPSGGPDQPHQPSFHRPLLSDDEERRNFLVSVRLSVHDLLPGREGMSQDDICYVAETLASSGNVDLITTSVGHNESPVPTTSSSVPRAAFACYTKAIRNHLHAKGLSHIPIAASHRVNNPTDAEALLESGVCDMVGIARPLIADAAFVENCEKDDHLASMPCIACNKCSDILFKAKRVGCAINPISGYELERLPLLAPPSPKSIAVVGAGPAGITCALTLSRRGHQVVLYEQNDEIGGQLNMAKVIPGKEEYYMLLEHWTQELRRSNVTVKLNSEFTREEVSGGQQLFHAMVLCCGSVPRLPTSHRIIGAENKKVVGFWDVLARRCIPGRKVGILGNGAIAHDVASYLIHDHRVSRDVSLFQLEWGVDCEHDADNTINTEHGQHVHHLRRTGSFNYHHDHHVEVVGGSLGGKPPVREMPPERLASGTPSMAHNDESQTTAAPGFGDGDAPGDGEGFSINDSALSRVSPSNPSSNRYFGVNLDKQRNPRRNGRDVVVFQKPNHAAGLYRTKGWAQRMALKNHGATVFTNAMLTILNEQGIVFSTPMPDNKQLMLPVDTIVWAQGMLPHMTVSTWVYEWVKDGAARRGQLLDDFGIYLAGSCRHNAVIEGEGEQDLMRAVHEGFQIGSQI